MEIIKFIDNIVCYLIADLTLSENFKSEALLASLDPTNEDFAL